jgi:hypothetical protein
MRNLDFLGNKLKAVQKSLYRNFLRSEKLKLVVFCRVAKATPSDSNQDPVNLFTGAVADIFGKMARQADSQAIAPRDLFLATDNLPNAVEILLSEDSLRKSQKFEDLSIKIETLNNLSGNLDLVLSNFDTKLPVQ